VEQKQAALARVPSKLGRSFSKSVSPISNERLPLVVRGGQRYANYDQRFSLTGQKLLHREMS